MTSVDALQAWLALEHEAVWFYPVVGARIEALVDAATTSFEAHRDTRDALLARLRALDVEPVTASLSYSIDPGQDASGARAAAQSLETRISAACLTLVGEAEDGIRGYAVKNLRRSALAELTWGAPAKAFPGLP